MWSDARLAAPGGAYPRVDVLGVPVSAITMAQAVQAVNGWIARRTPHYVCVTGVHGVMECVRDDDLRGIHERAGLVTPETIDFMRKLDVKEIHGYERTKGLKLIKPDAVSAGMRR